MSAQNKPQKIYTEHIKVIESLFRGDTIYDLDKTVKFLEDITGIESETDQGFVTMYEPSMQNLKDWQNWYNKNKNYLYWDEKQQKVSVKMR